MRRARRSAHRRGDPRGAADGSASGPAPRSRTLRWVSKRPTGRWWIRCSSRAVASLRSIPNSSIAFAIALPPAARKMTGAMRMWSPMRCGPIARAFRVVRADDPAIIRLRELSSHRRRPAGGRSAARQSAAGAALSGARAVADAESRGQRALAVGAARVPRRTRMPGAACRGAASRPSLRDASHSPRDASTRSLTRAPPADAGASRRGWRTRSALRIALFDPAAACSCMQHRTGDGARIDHALEPRWPAADPSRGSLREHRDAEILQSLPGVGRVVTATMLTEASWPVGRRAIMPRCRRACCLSVLSVLGG